MEGKFTYANSEKPNWKHELFDTQAEALKRGLEEYASVLVGQLKYLESNYKVVNVYEFSEATLES